MQQMSLVQVISGFHPGHRVSFDPAARWFADGRFSARQMVFERDVYHLMRWMILAEQQQE
jgi:hypothetical protein